VLIKLQKNKDGLHLEVSDGVGKSGLTQGNQFWGQLINGTSIFFDFKIDTAA
jgi:hypothetical protein